MALGLFVLKRGRRKGPSATNEAAAGVQLKAESYKPFMNRKCYYKG